MNILNALQLKYVFKEKIDFLIDASVALYADLPESVKEFEDKPVKDQYYYDANRGNGWQNQNHFDVYLNRIDLRFVTAEQEIKIWNLFRWRQLNGLERNISYCKPFVQLYSVAFEQNLITEGELYEGILEPDKFPF